MLWIKLPTRMKAPEKPGSMEALHKEQLILDLATCHSALHLPTADPQHEALLLCLASGPQSTDLC